MDSNSTAHLSHLPAAEYHTNRGWVCTLLGIPGATVIDMRMDGVTIPLERLHISAPYIRFVTPPAQGIHDADVVVAIPTAGGSRWPVPVTVALITLFGVIFGAILNHPWEPGASPGREQAKALRPNESPQGATSMRLPTKRLAAGVPDDQGL